MCIEMLQAGMDRMERCIDSACLVAATICRCELALVLAFALSRWAVVASKRAEFTNYLWILTSGWFLSSHDNEGMNVLIESLLFTTSAKQAAHHFYLSYFYSIHWDVCIYAFARIYIANLWQHGRLVKTKRSHTSYLFFFFSSEPLFLQHTWMTCTSLKMVACTKKVTECVCFVVTGMYRTPPPVAPPPQPPQQSTIYQHVNGPKEPESDR